MPYGAEPETSGSSSSSATVTVLLLGMADVVPVLHEQGGTECERIQSCVKSQQMESFADSEKPCSSVI